MPKRKIKINTSVKERCLLTEAMPFETPIFFSNWGSFHYTNVLRKTPSGSVPGLVRELFTPSDPKNKKYKIPYEFRVKKDLDGFRTLHLIHPGCSDRIVQFYSRYEHQITKLCEKSSFSIRSPVDIAKYFLLGEATADDTKYIEELDESKPYTTSYFRYKGYSYLYKYFESNDYLRKERSFSLLFHYDIAKFFPSIYTHSINWAVSGKREAKKLIRQDEDSIGTQFDELMQFFNDKETNGIVVGPEISRVFSEIIMQEIDARIERKMLSHDLENGVDYACNRYVDDIFLFVKDKAVAETFSDIARTELEHFKLHINNAKTKSYERPFITPISSFKNKIIKFIEVSFAAMSSEKGIDSRRAIFELRELIQESGANWNAITSVVLTAVIRQTNSLRFIKENIAFEKASRIAIDIYFTCLSFDIRIGGCYKALKFIMAMMSLAAARPPRPKSSIQLMLHHEVLITIKSALESKCIHEALALLIALDCIDYKAPTAQRPELLNIIEYLDEKNRKKKSHERLSYFEIVSILYYCRDKPSLSDIAKHVTDEAIKIMLTYSPNESAESFYLFFDVVSCPYVSRADKELAVDSINKGAALNAADRSRVINFIEKHTWYSSWQGDSKMAKRLLKKKEIASAY